MRMIFKRGILNKALFIALGLTVILQLHNTITFPPEKGFDAAGHIDYVQFVKIYETIPLPDKGWEFYQPPLYYFTASFFPTVANAKWMGFISWFGLLAISFYFFKKIYKSSFFGLLGSLLTTTLPVVIYLTPTISNELFSAVLISVAMVYYLLKRDKINARVVIILAIILSLATLSKVTAIVLVIAIIVDQIIINLRNVKYLMFLVGILFIFTGWFYIRNIYLYKSPFTINLDLPSFSKKYHPPPRKINFITDITAFARLDIFQAQHYSLLGGTYFSWFYDGHNNIIPVQSFSKIGNFLVIMSLPTLFFFIKGFLIALRHYKLGFNQFCLIYGSLLIGSYILFNFKYSTYSSVKGSYLVSLIIPFAYLTILGLQSSKQYNSLFGIYLLIYSLLVVKAFWILSGWYST